jgi:hypothetical protein
MQKKMEIATKRYTDYGIDAKYRQYKRFLIKSIWSKDYIHRVNFGHKDIISIAKICVCYACMRAFPTESIYDWVWKRRRGSFRIRQTALCPFCSVDSVIAIERVDLPTTRLVARLSSYWFYEVPRTKKIRYIRHPRRWRPSILRFVIDADDN